MATLEEVRASLEEVQSRLSVIDAKGDEIVALIDALSAAGGITPEQQAQLDAIASIVESIKAQVGAVEADQTNAMDGP
jgi:prefoldin subunit 5